MMNTCNEVPYYMYLADKSIGLLQDGEERSRRKGLKLNAAYM